MLKNKAIEDKRRKKQETKSKIEIIKNYQTANGVEDEKENFTRS
jgi:hypothetical protein